MKKFLPCLLLLSLLLPLISSCATPKLSTEASTAPTKTAETEKTEEKEPIVIPEGFAAGFGRRELVNASFLPIPTFDGNEGVGIEAPCYVTSVALSDGENLVLMLSFDIRGADSFLVQNTKKILSQKYGIPQENILICTTHNHAGPDMGRKDGILGAWYSKMFSTFIPEAVEESLRDLAPAEMYGGVADTTGLNFVRRYLLSDGSWKTNPSKDGATPVEHESQADPEMRLIRFDREGKTPIVMVNWQCHPASSYSKGTVNTDFVHQFRRGSESQYKIHLAFYQGAAGDVIHSSAIAGEAKVSGYDKVGAALVPVLGTGLKNMTKLSTGKIRVLHSELEGALYPLSEEKIAATNAYNATSDTAKRAELLATSGIQGRWEINRNTKIIRYRNEGKDSVLLPHTAIAIGDFAIATAGYEMFHQNGKAVRDASPFAMTFVCAYTDANLGYIPTETAFSHGGYEVYSCIFQKGQGEACANEMIRLLRQVAK